MTVRRFLQLAVLSLVLELSPATATAEWQVRPFAGATFGGTTTFVNLDDVAGNPKLNLGISTLWQGDIFGLEGDVATTPGFFSGDPKRIQTLVLRSHVATITGNVVVAMPKRIAQDSLRPYVVAGLGWMHVGIEDNLQVLPFSDAIPAWDVGGGVTGFLTDFVGVNWDVRLFRTLGSDKGVTGVSIGPEQLSFWRATMGLSIRL